MDEKLRDSEEWEEMSLKENKIKFLLKSSRVRVQLQPVFSWAFHFVLLSVQLRQQSKGERKLNKVFFASKLIQSILTEPDKQKRHWHTWILDS